jgi:hypothetical protein
MASPGFNSTVPVCPQAKQKSLSRNGLHDSSPESVTIRIARMRPGSNLGATGIPSPLPPAGSVFVARWRLKQTHIISPGEATNVPGTPWTCL